jgi:glycerol uptake facilitator-like aquaporin
VADRVIAALLAALASFFRSLWRVIRQLFHEITGAFFLLFAVIGGVNAWRHWQRGSELWVLGLVLVFTLMMAAFAFAAFRSARKAR